MLVGTPAGTETGGGVAILTGVLLALGCAAGIAAHALGSRRIAGRHHALLPLAIAPVALASGFSLDQPPSGWLLVRDLGVVPSALAYAMCQRGLRHLPASTATIVTLAEPLTAAVLDRVLFGERLSPVGLPGGVLLLTSIVALSRRPIAAAPVPSAPKAAG